MDTPTDAIVGAEMIESEAGFQAMVIATIPGRPIAKGRPRMVTGGHPYTPERTRDAEQSMALIFKQACRRPLDGPLELLVGFSFRYPRSWPKAQRQAVEDGCEPWYTGKPDLDNLVKLVKDAGNGILWHDDAQVVSLDAHKIYGVEDETWINLRALGTIS